MDCGVSLGVVANSNLRVQPYSTGFGERIIGMNKTAFRSFEMMPSKRVWYATKPKAIDAVEWSGVKDNLSIY